jgi:hypothetical protein
VGCFEPEKPTFGIEVVLVGVQIITGMGTNLTPNLFSKTSNMQIAGRSVRLFSFFQYSQDSEDDKEDATVGGTQDNWTFIFYLPTVTGSVQV